VRRIALITVAAAALASAIVPSGRAAAPKPVPSLTPAATHRLWEQLVATRASRARALARVADCRPARAIFYAATDWLRLATNLEQNASPCAQYYVTVPPLSGDKSQPRPGQAAQIRALGANMHALAEISFTGWSNWVSANGSDWFTAGVTARQRMATAGYDVAAGDTWAMNEVSTAVRRNTGSARSNLSEFLRGLADGGGNPAKGVVFIVGQNQGGDQSLYKANLQAWLQDSTFWNTVGQYVSDWLQETYGDMRAYAVSGAPPQQRRDSLVQFLGHPLALSNAGGDLTPSARAFMVANYGPLANAAWAWSSAYGWTAVPFDQMQDYVSAQAYAMRALDAQSGFTSDRLGFAWAPNNTTGLSGGDFTRQTAAILQRLAQAVRDSGETVDPNDPGIGACQPSWCQTVIPGAAFTDQWSQFSTWTSTGVAFAKPVTMTAGTTAGPLTVQLQTGSVLSTATADTPVTLTTTSTKGQFSTAATGPWSRSLVVTIPTGQSAATFYYQDTVAGTPTITAQQAGQPPATQVETVVAAAPARVQVQPGSATVVSGQKRLFAARISDAFGNPSTAPVTWTVPAKLGTVTPATGGSTTFIASPTATGRGKLTARVGGLSDTAFVTVKLPPARIGGTLIRHVDGYVVVTVWVVRGGSRAAGVPVSLVVRRGTGLVAQVTGRTDKHGRFVWRSKHRLPAGHYTAKAAVR
jgi:hypothetical protein